MGTMRDTFRTTEFESWAHRIDWSREERWMLEHFLDPEGSVVEGGTGGGRLVLALKAMGFRRMAGFDFVPAMIEVARQRDTDRLIDFRVQDATCLDYPDAAFDQAIYLQQLLCLLDGDEPRRRALGEVHRILKPGGVALFSFLGFEARTRSLVGRAFLKYLALYRALTFTRRHRQELPLLKRGGKPNARALWDAGPHVYWFSIPEVHDLLSAQGFEIFAAGVDHELARGIVHPSCAEMADGGSAGTIYAACRKK
jgi:SAM-dependent methyltransferase